MELGWLNFDADPQTVVVAPSCFPQARETSAMAAIQVQPKRVTQNTQLLELLKTAGDRGLSDLEIQQVTGWLRQSICARRRDCRSLMTKAETRQIVGKFRYQRWKLKEDSDGE